MPWVRLWCCTFDSGWAKELFAASACNRTPTSAHDVAYVLYAPVSRDPEASKRCASILSDTETLGYHLDLHAAVNNNCFGTACLFVTEESKAQFKQRRAFRRYCGALVLGSPLPLSQIVFKETEKGRPYLPDLPDVRFSFSSSSFGFLGAWSSTHLIGIDIEDQTRKLETVELAQQFFSEAEAKAVEEVGGLARLRSFFHLWSLKEAALKSIGEGLPFGLDAFEFELTPNLRVVHAPRDHGGPERFNGHVVEGTNSCAGLVTGSMSDGLWCK